MRFTGSSSYVATDELTLAVNAAISLQRPLLIKGEPGTRVRLTVRRKAGGEPFAISDWNVSAPPGAGGSGAGVGPQWACSETISVST